MTIVLFGNFGGGNFGNEASLAAMVAELRQRYPAAEPVCICPHPIRVRDEHKIRAYGIRLPPSRGWPKRLLSGIARRAHLTPVIQAASVLRSLGDLDFFIIPGTGILDDFGETPWGMPWDLLVWCILARIYGARIFFCSVGAGPVGSPLTRFFMKLAIQVAQCRSYRDAASREFARSLGVDVGGDNVVPDLVFSHILKRADEERDTSAGRMVVGVGVMRYYGWKNQLSEGLGIYQGYIEKMSSFVGWLLDSGYAVRVVTGERDDEIAVTNILEAVGKGSKNSRCSGLDARPIGSFEDVTLAFAGADVVVATRFHNVVAALLLEKPVISLGYANKNALLLSPVGLDAYCQHIESFDVDVLQRHFLELVGLRRRFRQRIRCKNREYRERLTEHFNAVFGMATRDM